MLTKSYSVTPDQLNHFHALAATNGIDIPEGNSGVIQSHGITMDFTYDQTTLKLTITSKPFYITTSMVWNELDSYLT